MHEPVILKQSNKEDIPGLIALWEASVRATHGFLSEDDILFFKAAIEENDVFSFLDITCARISGGQIAGFVGVWKAQLEVLFIDPLYIGKGIGKGLLLHAVNVAGVCRVDVNEQNEQARGFYEHFGFRVTERSEQDGMGKPFPILHMELKA